MNVKNKWSISSIPVSQRGKLERGMISRENKVSRTGKLLWQIWQVKVRSLGRISNFQIQRKGQGGLGGSSCASQVADLTENTPLEVEPQIITYLSLFLSSILIFFLSLWLYLYRKQRKKTNLNHIPLVIIYLGSHITYIYG